MNTDKFDKLSFEVYGVAYNEIRNPLNKKYICERLIHEHNTIYCEYCVQEDHDNIGKCSFCGANIHKKFNMKIMDYNNKEINIIGNYNTNITDKKSNININGNHNINISDIKSTSNINITIK